MAYQQDYRIVGEAARLMADQVARNTGLSGLVAGYGMGTNIRDRSDREKYRRAMGAAYNPQTGGLDMRRAVGAAIQYDPDAAMKMMEEGRLQDQQRQVSALVGGLYAPGDQAGPGLDPDDPEPLRVRGEKLLQLGVQTSNPAYVNAGKADIERYQAETLPTEVPMGVAGKQTVPRWKARKLLAGADGGVSVQPSASPSVLGAGTSQVQPLQSAAVAAGAGTAGRPSIGDLTGYYVGKYGLPPYQAAALAGNMWQESSGNPTAVGDGGASFGLGQWNGSRRAELEQFARASGRPMTDWTTQADFALYEMRQGKEREAGNAFFGTRNLQDATNTLSSRFFRPGFPNIEARQRMAQNAYQSVGGGVPASGPVAASGAGVGAMPGWTPPPEEVAGRTAAAQAAARQPFEMQRIAAQAAQDREQAAYQTGLDYSKQARLAEEAQPREIGSEIEKAWVKESYIPVMKAAQGARKQRQQLDIMERLNAEGRTGPGAAFWQQSRRFLLSAGIPSQEIEKSTANIEAMRALNMQASNELLLQANGVQTEGDVERAMAIFPSIEKTGSANQFLIDYHRAVLSQVERQAEFYAENKERFGKSPSRMEQAWLRTEEANRSIWDDPAMAKWKGAAAENPVTGGPATPAGTAGGPSIREQLQAELARRRGVGAQPRREGVGAQPQSSSGRGATGVW